MFDGGISIAKNKKLGLIGERIAQLDYQANGYLIEPMSKGCDFVAIKKPYQEYVEVKIGKSRMTKAQKELMRKVRKEGYRYVVYRITKEFLQNYLASIPVSVEIDLNGS